MKSLVRILGRPPTNKCIHENDQIYPVCPTLLNGAGQPTNMAPDSGSGTCDRRWAMQAPKLAGARVDFLKHSDHLNTSDHNTHPPWGPVALAKLQCPLRHVAASYPPRETTQGALVIMQNATFVCTSPTYYRGGQCGIERVNSLRLTPQRGCSRQCGSWQAGLATNIQHKSFAGMLCFAGML